MPEGFRGRFSRHLVNDPCEIHDRAGEEKAVAEELSAKLQGWVDHNLAGERTDPMFEDRGAWHCWPGQEQ